MLLTQKSDYDVDSMEFEESEKTNLCKAGWKRVQALASVFGSRWKREYLPLLQSRRKWIDSRRDIRNEDVVLLKDKNIVRTRWPTGVIVNAIKGSDDRVRKAEVRVIVNGKPTTYTRPIVDMILLVEGSDL